jgi:NitT/TauT family transport system substrate-binding protein
MKRMIVAALAVSACATAFAQTKLNLRLDWKPGAQHAPFYLAKQKGYYAQEGVDLNIVSGSGSSDSVKQVGSRAVDVAIVDALVMVQAAEQRVPVKSIAVYYQRTAISIISPKTKPITSVQQLTGDVKVGAPKASATSQGLIALLSVNNIKIEQVKVVDIGFGVQPLLVKQVDALMAFTNIQPIELETAGMPVHELLIADHGVNVYGLTLASNDDFIAKQPAALAGFLRATKKSVLELASAKQSGVDAVAKSVPEIDAAREMKVLDRTFPLWSTKGGDLAGFGAQSEQGWRETIDTAKRLGLVEASPAPRALFNASFLR